MGSQGRGGRGGYSGSSYDMWSYQQAAKSGTLADSPLNKIQHKFWVTKQAVTRKLNKDEDEHIVASDSELDAKLELFRSIQQTSGRLQRLLEIYQVGIQRNILLQGIQRSILQLGIQRYKLFLDIVTTRTGSAGWQARKTRWEGF